MRGYFLGDLMRYVLGLVLITFSAFVTSAAVLTAQGEAARLSKLQDGGGGGEASGKGAGLIEDDEESRRLQEVEKYEASVHTWYQNASSCFIVDIVTAADTCSPTVAEWQASLILGWT